jgi:two-component system sensor histidine kinase YesM
MRAKKLFVAFKGMKIRSKLLLAYSLALLPMLLLGAHLVNNTSRLVLQQRFAQTASDNKRVKSIIFDVTYLVTNMAETIFYDQQLQGILSTQYADSGAVYAAYRNFKLLDSYVNNYTEISGLMLYTDNATLIPTSHIQPVTDEIRSAEWFIRAANSSSEILWMVDTGLERLGSLRLVRKIPLLGTNKYAVLVINVSNNYLKLMINDGALQTIAVLNGNRVFFSDDAADIGKPLAVEYREGSPQATQSYATRYKGQDVFASASVQSAVRAVDKFQIITIDRDAPGNVASVTWSAVFILAVSLAVPYVAILLFVSAFSRRILRLRSEMHKVAGGDFNIVDSIPGRDELSDVFSDMKVMIDCIQNLYREIYSEKLTRERLINRQQRVEFELLSSQINPHFLFNTLETMRMKAYLNGDREVANIAKLLGRSMRHVLEVGHAPVPLSSEIDYIRVYIQIQAYRFRDKIGYDIAVDDAVDAEHYLILPLLLQPVVENAIVHGLEDKDGNGRVRIIIEKNCGALIVVVEDDGIGMEEAACAALQKSLEGSVKAQGKGGIGIMNVHQRIRLFYGPEYGLSIESRMGEGTKVTLRLPADGRGIVGNDSADR